MSITGAEQFDMLARRLAATGTDFRLEVQRSLQAEAPRLVDRAQQAAGNRLPKAGGLNVQVARSPFVVDTLTAPGQVGIRIGTRTKSAASETNKGRFRHPVFGHRDRWVAQRYTPAKDWFTDAMLTARPEVEKIVAAAVERAIRKTTGGSL